MKGCDDRGRGGSRGSTMLVLAALLGSAASLPAMAQQAVNFEIAAPVAGSVVSNPVQLDVTLTQAEIGLPSMGLDHLHVAVDGGKEQAIYQPGVITLQLPPGEHTLSVELAGPNHRALLPAKQVTFTVE